MRLNAPLFSGSRWGGARCVRSVLLDVLDMEHSQRIQRCLFRWRPGNIEHRAGSRLAVCVSSIPLYYIHNKIRNFLYKDFAGNESDNEISCVD